VKTTAAGKGKNGFYDGTVSVGDFLLGCLEVVAVKENQRRAVACR